MATDGGGEDVAREAVPRLAIGIAALIAFIVAFGALAALVQDQELNALDAVASPFVHSFATPALDALMTGASLVGSVPSLIAITILACLVALIRGRPGLAAVLGFTAVGGMVLNEVLKDVVARPRPKLEWAAVLPDYSVPSGHTMDSTIVMLAVALMAWALFGARIGRVAVGIAAVLVLLVGVSRIYLGAHYLTDVIGGFLAGGIWLAVILWTVRGVARQRGKGVATPDAR
jgi:undecaprenyl-diphosphatase